MEYGTPFDLEELNNISGLNIDSITYVKIIDVVGCIQDEFATYDSQENIVNDPWPTLFPSGGFDLDAVGVIHNITNAGISQNDQIQVSIYPNPSRLAVNFKFTLLHPADVRISIYNLAGKQVKFIKQFISSGEQFIRWDHKDLPAGMYFYNIVINKKYSSGNVVVTK